MKPINALTRALRTRDHRDADVRDLKNRIPGWPKVSPIKGLSAEEWTDAAVQSLTDDSLTLMVRSVAALFKLLKDEAMRRGLWDALTRERPYKPTATEIAVTKARP